MFLFIWKQEEWMGVERSHCPGQNFKMLFRIFVLAIITIWHIYILNINSMNASFDLCKYWKEGEF